MPMPDPYAEVRGLLRTGATRHAAELQRLGWTVVHQFYAPGDDEPYEIGLVWEREGEPARPSENAADWVTPPGSLTLITRARKSHGQ